MKYLYNKENKEHNENVFQSCSGIKPSEDFCPYSEEIIKGEYLIYKITSPNGKSYIGQTKNTFNKRWNSYKYKSKNNINHNNVFLNAIRKYGHENFTIKILIYSVKTKEEINFLEKYYIDTLNTLTPNGYNMTSGGDGVELFGELNGMYGRTHSEETKKIISEKNKNNTQREDYINYWDSRIRSREELAIRAKKASDAAKRNFENLSDEEKEEVFKKRSDKTKNMFKKMSPERKEEMYKKIFETQRNFSDEKKKEIGEKKARKKEDNGRARFYILISPEGTEHLVSMQIGVELFCENNDLDFNSIFELRNKKDNVVTIPSKRNTKYSENKNPEYYRKRTNSIGWSIKTYKRIKL